MSKKKIEDMKNDVENSKKTKSHGGFFGKK
jgi:hypothetical protein